MKISGNTKMENCDIRGTVKGDAIMVNSRYSKERVKELELRERALLEEIERKDHELARLRRVEAALKTMLNGGFWRRVHMAPIVEYQDGKHEYIATHTELEDMQITDALKAALEEGV